MIKSNRRVLALTTVVASVALFAPGAQAAPPLHESGTFDDTYGPFDCDAGTPDDPSDDFTATERHVGQYALTLNDRNSAPTGFLFGTERGSEDSYFTATWPDGSTVKWSAEARWLTKDVKILSFDEATNTATVKASNAVHVDMFAPDGAPDASNDQRLEWTFTLDLSTGEGAFIELTKEAGRRAITGTLCGDAMRFAGRT
jgi:hypothetical protein